MDKIFKPGPNNVFVFGSNLAGIHGKGAALDAIKFYGAIRGQGIGRQGMSYAIPTKDRHLRTLPLSSIEYHVNHFLAYARTNLTDMFFVTRVGCGLAGHRDVDIAPMFTKAPWNVELPEGWRRSVCTQCGDTRTVINGMGQIGTCPKCAPGAP